MIPLLAPVIAFFTKNKYSTIVTAVAVALLLLFMHQRKQTQKAKFQLAVAEHNLNAANDTIRIVKDKAGQIEYDKLAFFTDKLSNLEKLNADLAADVKKIKGTVATVIKGDIRIIHDTVPLIVHGELIDSTVRADFNYDSTFSPGNFKKLKGYTTYDLRNGKTAGQLLQDEVGVRITTGIKNLDKGKPEIFLKSDHPGFSVTQLDGAVLDPKMFTGKTKTKLITTGLNIGWTPVTYDLRTKKADVNLTRLGATFGVNINIIKLLTNKP